ncbi:unnamed protein product [Rangifer tarandus platyrhynchus]|uniref:Uncharacterized protein n=1 Tax=Rangifer tarandus platyrhynchus TaxID=3082113 RepID=A0AC59ZYB6_RANTA
MRMPRPTRRLQKNSPRLLAAAGPVQLLPLNQATEPGPGAPAASIGGGAGAGALRAARAHWRAGRASQGSAAGGARVPRGLSPALADTPPLSQADAAQPVQPRCALATATEDERGPQRGGDQPIPSDPRPDRCGAPDTSEGGWPASFSARGPPA